MGELILYFSTSSYHHKCTTTLKLRCPSIKKGADTTNTTNLGSGKKRELAVIMLNKLDWKLDDISISMTTRTKLSEKIFHLIESMTELRGFFPIKTEEFKRIKRLSLSDILRELETIFIALNMKG